MKILLTTLLSEALRTTSHYGLCFLSSVVRQFATYQGKARQKDDIRARMVGHQIVASGPYCLKNEALRHMRKVGILSGLSAEHIVMRSCCLKGYSMDSLTSKELKSRRNEHAVRGRPTQKEVEHIRNGSVRMPYERSIYQQTF